VGDPAQPVKRHWLAEDAVRIARQSDADVELHVVSGGPPERMPLEMSACDALVLTSLHEGSPMVVKEALACNIPVVSVDVGDVAERMRGNPACRLVPPEPGAISSALDEVLHAGARGGERR